MPNKSNEAVILKRNRLLNALLNVEPGLAVNQLIPIMTHFWFTGSNLMTFNDQIAISVPLRTGFKGAISPKLLELLKTIDGADDDEIEIADGSANTSLVVKAGRAKLQLGKMPPDFLFDMPKPEGAKVSAKKIQPLVKSIEHCLISVGSDTSVVEQLGITMISDAQGVRLFSTDGGTISHAYVDMGKKGVSGRAILPGAFCQQMLRLYHDYENRENAEFSFEIAKRDVREGVTDNYALFTAGKAKLYGRLLHTRNPLDFDHVMKFNLPRNYKTAAIPPRLKPALDRASIVCDLQRRQTRFTVENGKLKLFSETETEQVRDEMPFKNDDVSISVEPKLLRRAVNFDELAITKTCVIFQDKEERLYLVSCREVKGD